MRLKLSLRKLRGADLALGGAERGQNPRAVAGQAALADGGTSRPRSRQPSRRNDADIRPASRVNASLPGPAARTGAASGVPM